MKCYRSILVTALRSIGSKLRRYARFEVEKGRLLKDCDVTTLSTASGGLFRLH
jgi:hypothetical protein